jgi:two-component system nitrate/nitrite response regulator NarL
VSAALDGIEEIPRNSCVFGILWLGSGAVTDHWRSSVQPSNPLTFGKVQPSSSIYGPRDVRFDELHGLVGWEKRVMTRLLGSKPEEPLDQDSVCTTGRATRGRLLVVEELALVAAGIRLALTGLGWDVEVSSGHSRTAMTDDAQRFQPQSVLLSVRVGSGVDEAIARIESLASTGAHVLLLTAERRKTVLARFLEAGAAGWIGKDVTLEAVDLTLMELISGRSIVGRTIQASLLNELRLERANEQCVIAMFDELTQREALVLAALSDGLTADEIAREHFVAVSTIRSQIRGVLQKLEVRSQLSAVALGATHRQLLPQRGTDAPDRRQAQALVRGQESEIVAVAN